MRKINTIVAVVATIIMLGAVAQAQTWNQLQAYTNGGSYGYTGTQNISIRQLDGTTIANIYNGTTGTFTVHSSVNQNITVANYYATNSTWKTVLGDNTANRVNFTNFYLQVGVLPGLTGTGASTFGSGAAASVGTVTVANNGIWIGDVTDANKNGVNATNYGVRVDGGTVSTLNISGGTVRNAGTITALNMNGGKVENHNAIGSLIFGSGEYVAAGTNSSIGTLGFTAGTDLNIGLDAFGLKQFTNVGTYDLSATNLLLDATGLEFVDGIASILFNFGGTNKIVGDFALFTLTGFLGGVENLLFNAFGTQEFQGYDVELNDTGVFFALIPVIEEPGDAVVPEPATLAVLGLGLAGLGLARRRRK